MKPKILIPLALGDEPKESPRYFARIAYASAIEQAGGIPIFIGRGETQDLEELSPLMDGLLLQGGVDPHPKLYGEEVLPVCGAIDAERDATELALLTLAMKKNIPIFGLCRGMQIMNVHFGGSLYQDIPTQLPSQVEHCADATTERKKVMHPVDIVPGTQLHLLLGVDHLDVNSLHHQGIKALGQGLVASAKSPDGLIEGIERPVSAFCIGVEWHPEELDDTPSKKLFSAFIFEAGKARDIRSRSL